MKALVIAEHDNEALQAGTLNTVTAALQMADEVDLLVAGHGCAAVAAQAARVAGVTRVLHCEAPHYGEQLAEPLAALVCGIAGGYTHLVAPAGVSGRNLMPRVAATLGVSQISGIVRVDAGDTFTRPIYAGNALATVQALDSRIVLTVRATAFAPAGGGAPVPVEPLAPAPDPALSRRLSRTLAGGDRPDLASARVVVSGGRALGSAENFGALLEPLAGCMGAALGASRAAVDAGYAGNDCQVGQTGRVVAPDLYIAVGISGAIQHLAGMKDSKVIVAINSDPDAPIFGVADYALVADLFDAVPALTHALKSRCIPP
jgi:electron transfer flavoprotein alpha subunit